MYLWQFISPFVGNLNYYFFKNVPRPILYSPFPNFPKRGQAPLNPRETIKKTTKHIKYISLKGGPAPLNPREYNIKYGITNPNHYITNPKAIYNAQIINVKCKKTKHKMYIRLLYYMSHIVLPSDIEVKVMETLLQNCISASKYDVCLDTMFKFGNTVDLWFV